MHIHEVKGSKYLHIMNFVSFYKSHIRELENKKFAYNEVRLFWKRWRKKPGDAESERKEERERERVREGEGEGVRDCEREDEGKK